MKLFFQHEVMHAYDDTLHLFTSISSINFTVKMNNNNTKIGCIVQQMDGNEKLLFIKDKSLSLRIFSFQNPHLTTFNSSVNLFLGVFITMIVVLLICIFFTAFMCQRQKKRLKTSDTGLTYTISGKLEQPNRALPANFVTTHRKLPLVPDLYPRQSSIKGLFIKPKMMLSNNSSENEVQENVFTSTKQR